MSSRDNLENLLKSLNYLKEENNGIPIIVEGKNDIRALRRLGFNGEIIKLPRNLSLENFCRLLSQRYNNVILLMDWDTKGRRNILILTKYLRHYGVSVSIDFWKLCFSLASRMSNVEGLPAAFEAIEAERDIALRI
ncbi:MAG: toprim domain-containing protein [Thermoplasmata archaeon]